MSKKIANAPTRRTVLKAGSALAISSLFAGHTIAQQDYNLKIEQYPEGEYVVITNAGEEDVDLTGFEINFEAEDDDYNQIRELAGEVVLAPGNSITVPTGARDVDADPIVELAEPYDGEVLRNDGSDVVALLDTDGNTVASTDASSSGGDGDETHTLTLTIIDPDEDPVADANIGIVTYDGGEDVASGTTDENGQATFELSNGQYEIAARTDDYVNPSDDRLVGIDGEDVERTIQLVPLGSGDDEEPDESDDGDSSSGDTGDEPEGDDGDDESDDDTTDDCPN